MDLKHPLDLSKMGFFSKASACTSNVIQYCLSQAMREMISICITTIQSVLAFG